MAGNQRAVTRPPPDAAPGKAFRFARALSTYPGGNSRLYAGIGGNRCPSCILVRPQWHRACIINCESSQQGHEKKCQYDLDGGGAHRLLPCASLCFQGSALEWSLCRVVADIRRFSRGAFGCCGSRTEQASFARDILPHRFQDNPAGRLAQGAPARARDRKSLRHP